MKIALDAMGGDFGPPHLVPGAVIALKEYPHINKLFLVGDTAQIEAELKKLNAEREQKRLRAAQKGLPAGDSEELKQWSAADFQAYVVDLETQKKLDERLLDDTAAQAWKLADIALNKARLTRTAYCGAFAFLILWPFARFMDAVAH